MTEKLLVIAKKGNNKVEIYDNSFHAKKNITRYDVLRSTIQHKFENKHLHTETDSFILYIYKNTKIFTLNNKVHKT